jgi:septum formation protein
MRLILASTSPFRLALLAGVGLQAEVRAPDFDEVAMAATSPAVLAPAFAAGKARSLLASECTRSEAAKTAFAIIGADQVLEVSGAILRKPDPNSALAMVDQLLSLAGKTHTLYSAVHVIEGSADGMRSEQAAIAETELKMRILTRAEAERYVELDHPVGAVGSYLYERRGRWLFESVRGSDDSAIIGLPLIPLLRLLRNLGIDPLAPTADR